MTDIYPITTEPGSCGHCGSTDTYIERVEFGVSILVWLRCLDCDGETIDCYEHSCKGITHEDGEE